VKHKITPLVLIVTKTEKRSSIYMPWPSVLPLFTIGMNMFCRFVVPHLEEF